MHEMELMAMSGMFLWTDCENFIFLRIICKFAASEVSAETLQLCLLVRNEIIVDLHKYYRSLGLGEEEITLKTANLFLLIPKLEAKFYESICFMKPLFPDCREDDA